MKTKLFAFSMLLMSASCIQAQTLTTDGGWCKTIEQILADKGIQATARCDRDGNNKIIHLTVGNQTQRYRVPLTSDKIDYSSTVLVVVDALDYGPQWGRNSRRLMPQNWHGSSSLISQRPDEVWEDVRDLGYIEDAIHKAIERCTRTSELDAQYIQKNLQNGQTVLTLKCRVLDLQRGEQYEKGNNDRGSNEIGRGSVHERQRVTKRMACARVVVQLVDNRTGEVIANQEFSSDDYVYESSTTDPMSNVVRRITNDIASNLSQRYPSSAPRPAVVGTILKADEINEKRGRVETLYIDCGTAQELRTNEEFTVYREVDINGNKGTTAIGKIKVREIKGTNLSLCKVSKGDKEIYEALTAGDKLIVR